MAKKKTPVGKKSSGGSSAKSSASSAAGAATIDGKATEPKKKKSPSPLEFFQQVRNEMAKVTWTSRNETLVSTIMVLIMVAIMAFFFFVVDWGLRNAVCTLLPIDCVPRDAL